MARAASLVGQSELRALPDSQGLRAIDSFGLHDGRTVRQWSNLRAGTAVLKLDRA